MLKNEYDVKYVRITNIFLDSLDKSILKAELSGDSSEYITYLMDMFLTERIYRFLNPLEMVRISNELFSNVKIRDYILELTDDFIIQLQCYDYLPGFLVNNFTRALHSVHNNIVTDSNEIKKYDLMPKQIGDSLRITSEVDLKATLNDNLWYLVLMLVVLNFKDSTVFHSITTHDALTNLTVN